MLKVFRKQERKRTKFVCLTITTILIILSTSCTSTQIKNDIPSIRPPDPVVNGESVVVYNSETETVYMPLWYWLRLTDYIIDTQSLMKSAE